MKKILSSLIILATCLTCHSQSGGKSFNPPVGMTNSLANSEGDYLLDDITSPAAWAYSADRKLTNAWTSSFGLVVRSSDGATNYLITGSRATIEAWAGAGNDVYLTNWFDQTGHGRHMVNGDTNTCPRIVTNGVAVTQNGHLAVRFIDNDALNAASVTLSLPVTYQLGLYSYTRTTSDMFVNGNATTRLALRQASTAAYNVNNGSSVATQTLTLNQWDLATLIFAVGDDSMQIDDGTFSLIAAGDNTMQSVTVGSSTICADFMMTEWVGYNSALSESDTDALGLNMNTYWNLYTPVP